MIDKTVNIYYNIESSYLSNMGKSTFYFQGGIKDDRNKLFKGD